LVKILSLFFSFALIASSSLAQSEFAVAKVNNAVIVNSDLSDRYLFVITTSKLKVNSSEDKRILLSQILDKMIDEELVRQDAEKSKMVIDPEEMRLAIDSIAIAQKKNATQFKLSFMSQKLSFDNYLKQLEAEIFQSKIIREVIAPRVVVTEAEIKEYLEQRKISSDIRKFLIAEIVIAQGRDAKVFAEKLYSELLNGSDFKKLVKQFSSSVHSENNGEIGWVSRSEISEKIYTAISSLKKGEYAAPIMLDDGYHIFKLIDAKTEYNVADSDANIAKNAIFSKKLQSLAKGYLMDLRKNAFIEKKL
jgi:peptidyl-prolyl cis-trans isomerase SurA